MGAARRRKHIRNAKVVTIRPTAITGHAAAGGAFAPDVEFINRETIGFLDIVPEGGKKSN